MEFINKDINPNNKQQIDDLKYVNSRGLKFKINSIKIEIK